MSMFFAMPDAAYQQLVMWHARRNYSRVHSAIRLLYVVLMLSTLGHLYVKYPTRANLTVSCLLALVSKQLKHATRSGLLGF